MHWPLTLCRGELVLCILSHPFLRSSEKLQCSNRGAHPPGNGSTWMRGKANEFTSGLASVTGSYTRHVHMKNIWHCHCSVHEGLSAPDRWLSSISQGIECEVVPLWSSDCWSEQGKSSLSPMMINLIYTSFRISNNIWFWFLKCKISYCWSAARRISAPWTALAVASGSTATLSGFYTECTDRSLQHQNNGKCTSQALMILQFLFDMLVVRGQSVKYSLSRHVPLCYI